MAAETGVPLVPPAKSLLRARQLTEAGKYDAAVCALLEGAIQLGPQDASLKAMHMKELSEPLLLPSLRSTMERGKKLVRPDAHAFLVNRIKYKHVDPSSSNDFLPASSQPSSDATWPGPKYVDWLCGRCCPVVDCQGSSVLTAEALSYVRKGRPCILRNLKVFPAAFKHWSFDYLAENISPDTTFSVFSSDSGDYSYWYGKANSGGFEFCNPTRREALKFKEFLQRGNEVAAGHVYLQDPLYFDPAGEGDGIRREVMSSSLREHWEEGLSWPALAQLRREGGLGSLKTSSLFCSGRGAYSRPHYDQSANLYLQIRGAKRWLLFEPEDGPLLYPYPKGHPLDRKSRLDFARPNVEDFPDAARLEGRGMIALIQPGDVLWLPSHWWHSVHSLEAETLALNFWWPPADTPDKMHWEHASVEVSRDLESLIQGALGTSSVERFLKQWRDGVAAEREEELQLRSVLLFILMNLVECGVLRGQEDVKDILRFLNARRYSGLSFQPAVGAAPVPLPRRVCTGATRVANAHSMAWRVREECRRSSFRAGACPSPAPGAAKGMQLLRPRRRPVTE